MNDDAGELAQIRDELLRRLYAAFFAGRDDVNLGDIREELGWDQRSFWRVLEGMSAEGLVTAPDSRPSCEIKAAGVLDAEAREIVPSVLASTNSRIRALILAQYAETYEAEGREGDRPYREVLGAVMSSTGVDEITAETNHQFLWDAELIDHPGSLGYFLITPTGLAAVRDWRQRRSLKDRFDALRDAPSPQARGRQFQGLFGELARDSGWRVDESVLGPGEEIDIVLNRQDAFYLLECRWKNEPVGAKEIRDFAGKLRKRSGVQGVFVSMSGYTVDAIDEVQAVTGETPIVLLGPAEVADLFGGVIGFNDLFVDKKRTLVLRRKAPWR